MENMNNQGKTPQQYEDSMRFFSRAILGILILMIIMVLFSGCYGTYYITDSEYDDVREEHLAVTYYNNSIYWGWNSGYYYYYGKPHYYPWYYYYSVCPPSYYNTTTHIIINKPVNKPTHRPNKPTHRPSIKVKTNTYRNTNVKTNVNRNKVIIKNNGSKRTNKTKITRRTKK